MEKSRKIGCAAVVSAVAAALALGMPSVLTAQAEDEPISAALTPVEAASDIAYAYFDMPSSVHAEASGIHVACGDGIVTVTVEQEAGLSFSEPKNIPADKAYKHGECYVALNDGALYSYYGDASPVEYSDFEIIDFDVFGDAVYAVGVSSLAVLPITDNALDVSSATVVALQSDRYRNIEVSAVAASSDKVFVALTSSNAPHKNDIAAVDVESGAIIPTVFQSNEIISLTYMAHSETVYALARDRITGYTVQANALKQKYISYDARMTDIYAYDGFLYTVDTLGALYRVSSDLKTYTALAASASDANGFFNSPASAAVKNSALYVADQVNNRIAKYGKELEYIDGFNSPVSVACDSRGTLYVAHDFDKVSIVDKTEFSVDGYIKQLVVNADKRVFVLTDNGLWTYDDAPDKISDTAYKAITLGIGRDDLYALGDDAVYKITKSDDGYDAERYCSAPDSAFSLAVDFKGNAYLLSSEFVTRVDNESDTEISAEIPLTENGKPYSVLNGGQILLSTVDISYDDTKYVNYGDAIIVDTYKHRVLSADGGADGLNVKLIDGEDYDVPDLVNDRTPEDHDGGLIRTTLYDVPVFSLPIETPEIYIIKKGRKVIVAEYDLEDTREYSLILIDDTVNHRLIQGYVYKDSLSDALEYADPPADLVSPYAGATPIYKWPSPHSKTLDGYSPAMSGDTLAALEFVEAYRDYKNNLWYRVRVGDEYEGFMMAADVNLGEYETTTIRPAYNAEIISYNDSKYAQAYILRDGDYTAIDIQLETGTQVEVVGAFDTSKRYTQIKCLTEFGTVTCYVETVYVEYNGVNVVLLVALLVILITAVLLAVIIARVFYLKKKRLTTPPEDEE